MFNRVYGKDKKCRRYLDCSICEDWHNFETFEKWYNSNYYEVGNEEMNLDKDILIKGNKIYSPETCIFVPKRINTLFIKRELDRNGLIGTYKSKRDKVYIARCSKGLGKRKTIGRYKTEIEAFNAYKEEKEKYIKQIADEYKNKIPQILYIALYNWKVETTD